MKFSKFFGTNKTFIIAEIGNNHEGSYQTAKKLIDKAAETKVDAVKFQTFVTEKFISTSVDFKRKKKLSKFQLEKKHFIQLSKYAKKKGLIFFSTPLDIESSKFLNKIQPIFKIASGDNNYLSLIKQVLKFNKPTIISTGMMNYDEIKKLNLLIKKENFTSKLGLMHCVSNYPATFKELNLNSINFLQKKFPNIFIGYSDHSNGIEACINAAVLGARIIEKHFTLNHNFSSFRDHKLSADPFEMKELVRKIRNFEIMRGFYGKNLSSSERKNLKSLRRSIATNRKLLPGDIIKDRDLIMLRPGSGLKENQKKLILGRGVRKAIERYEIIKRRKLN